ncbi:trigger factor [Lacihabitans sp. CCS-44]|uniref:trigger factor n=1 Tax=Lacihabitans sp. CCS-44 TaxID=2487331 RepID=UPI0020CF4171|nr:trigger factor [Lacihabitans sp. CCS-44]MCP9756715.1 trigger factor [Lacihabitans sp. CCS-44]
MQTKFDKVSSTLANLTVEVGEEDYKGLVDKKLKEYAKTAQVKGFRPGHVPLQYIKSIYGKGVLVDEVIKIASDEVNKTITDNKLNVVGEPTPKEDAYKIDWSAQKEFVFEYEIGFASDFTVDLEKLPVLTQYEIQPSDKQVNDTVEDLKNRFGVETEPEEAEVGDIIFGKLSQESSEFMFQSGIPTDKVKEESQKLFVGLEKGSSLKLDIQSIFNSDKELGFATGKSDEDAAALQGEFEFVVEKITRIKPSELTQELFDKVLGPGKASSEEEFLSQLTEIIKGNYNRESDFLLDFDVDKMLIDSTSIELPTEFLKKWLVEINQGKATVEDVEKEYDAIARGLKLDLIRTEIAKQNDLKIQYDDVLEEVKNEIRGYFGQQGGFEGMEEFIDSMAKKQLGEKNNEATKKHYEKAFGRKVLNFVKDKVKKETKSVLVEEFNEIASEKYKV